MVFEELARREYENTPLNKRGLEPAS